uniref:Agglutinin domain-containing protein n=1 Tax=Chenopodium quinoa TaxID=63459 RepID=A0A803LNT5_CHEQI
MESVPTTAIPTTVASKVICLKSAYNNKFLRYRNDIDSQTYGLLEFAGEEVTDQRAYFEIEQSKTYDGLVHVKSLYNNKYFVRVAHEVFEAPDGTLSIKSSYFGKFWRIDNADWIVPDVYDLSRSIEAEAKFRLVVRDVNVVALLNMSNTYFCKRFSTDKKENLLNAATKNIDEFAILMMIDLGGDLSSNTCTK